MVSKNQSKNTNRENSVHDWWVVCLNKGWVVKRSENWSENLTLNKDQLFNAYKVSCVGEAYGRLMFWTHLQRLVKVVSQTHREVVLPMLSHCRKAVPHWESHHQRVFNGFHLENESVNNVHKWWSVCLNKGWVVSRSDKWSENLVLNKDGLFKAYKVSCVGEAYGRLMFWTHLQRIVHVVSQTHREVVFPMLSDCRRTVPHWESEHGRVFRPTHVLSN